MLSNVEEKHSLHQHVEDSMNKLKSFNLPPVLGFSTHCVTFNIINTQHHTDFCFKFPSFRTK